MKNFFNGKTHSRLPFLLAQTLFFLLCFTLLFGLTACKRSIDYFSYVSELRNNIFLAETEEFSLRIYSVVKESPYAADGVPRETSARTEVYLVAPEGDKTCNLAFTVNGKEYGGEMSFDNVKTEYAFSCTLDVSECESLPCNIQYGDTMVELNAQSVLSESTLSPRAILGNVETENQELFKSLTDKYGFAGEIYIRLIFEDSPYYYLGIVDRSGKMTAFLVNAETGKILAKRQS